jgi:N-acetylglucosaminyldiphosphoundecaprenol N-acetyl-beta-D-mannosaminyltransferase
MPDEMKDSDIKASERQASYQQHTRTSLWRRRIPGPASAPDELTVLGIPINNIIMTEALEAILKWAGTVGARQVCFVNADCANLAYRNQAYLHVLQGADLCLADGIGIKLAGKLLGKDVRENVNGTDLFPKLCEGLCRTNGSVFLLGARDYVVQGVADWIHDNFPAVCVCGWQHGYFRPEEEQEIIQRIKNSGSQILLVAFGAPKQDLWIKEHLAETGVRVAMGVGGLFDFYSGRIPRAPLWMREIGMEWVYRLIQEPRRLWKRYLIGNGLFLWRVLRERLVGRKAKS